MLVESLLYSSGVEDVALFDALINPFERNAHTPYTMHMHMHKNNNRKLNRRFQWQKRN